MSRKQLLLGLITLREPNIFQVSRYYGNIRDGGGKFGEMGAAKEDEYFYKKTKQELDALRHDDPKKIELLKNSIEKLKSELRQHEKMLEELKGKK